MGIGDDHPKNEQEEVSLGCVFPMHPIIFSRQSRIFGKFFYWKYNMVAISRSSSRKKISEKRNAIPNGPFKSANSICYANSLHETQVHAIAAGHLILHVFHADWLRKLSSLVLETLVLDVDNEGLWLYDILPSLDEKVAGGRLRLFEKKKSITIWK